MLNGVHKLSSEASVDVYLSQYQFRTMDLNKNVMRYVNLLRELENILSESGSHISDKEKSLALISGLRKEFSVSVEVIRATNKLFPESIQLLVV